MALNNLANVQALHAGASRTERSDARAGRGLLQGGEFGGVSLCEQAIGQRVVTRSIDDLELPACGLIKVDVEGMEAEAIAGAAGTIRRLRPILYVENDRPDKSPPLIEEVLRHDYRLYWHLPPMFGARNFFGESQNVFPGLISAGMLGVPRESPLVVQGLRPVESPSDHWW